MHITILAHGSRSDIRPNLALAIWRSRAGRGAGLACLRHFDSLVRWHGIEFGPQSGDPFELAEKFPDEARANYLNATRALSIYTLPSPALDLRDTNPACLGTDGSMHSRIMTNAGHEVAVA